MRRRLHMGVLLTGCALLQCFSPRPHAVLSIEDPDGIAEAAESLWVGTLREGLRRRSLLGKTFPISLTVTGDREQTYPLVVEARDHRGTPIAGSARSIELRASGGSVVVIRLGPLCAPGSPNGAPCTIPRQDDAPGICLAGHCTPSRCGDDFVDGTIGETCDHGPANGAGEGACTAACDGVQRCGDEVVMGTEECDHGLGNGDDRACKSDCTRQVCGDGHVGIFAKESCDDGNDDDSDACTNACTLPGCGDGIEQAGELCDDGNTIETDACTDACTPATCGDSIVWTGEEACDDGPDNSDSTPDACRTDCTLPRCGDGVIDDGEACDDGAANSNTAANACRANCRPSSCGDSVLDDDEACDDGANDRCGDCNADCTGPGHGSPDSDGDGICDAEEICPAGDHETDSDSDGIPDDCDVLCPNDPLNDGDGDGICDGDDACLLGGPGACDAFDPAQSRIEVVSSSPTPADGTTAAVFRVVLRTASGSPIVGTNPVVAVSGMGATQPSCSTTNPQGEAACVMQSTARGWKEVRLTTPASPGDAVRGFVDFGFAHRRTVTIDSAQVPETLSSFPLLVRIEDPALASVNYGGAVVDAQGADIAFHGDDDVPLAHEIEAYDPQTGKLVAWVRLPELSHLRDTRLYLYYGDATVTNSLARPTDVWNADFAMVLHMSEGSGGNATFADSTDNGVVATTSGIRNIETSRTGVPCQVARCVRYEHYDSCQTTALPLDQQSRTHEMWLRITAEATRGGNNYFWNDADKARYRMAVHHDAANQWSVGYRPNGATQAFWYETAKGSIPFDQFTHVVITHDLAFVRIYIDGVLSRSFANITGPVDTAAAPAKMDDFGFTLFGFRDEYRASNVVRSSAYVWVSHRNQSAPETFLEISPHTSLR